MTTPRHEHSDDGTVTPENRPVGAESTATGTSSGADVTSRMTGTDRDRTGDRTGNDRTDQETDRTDRTGSADASDRTEALHGQDQRAGHAVPGTGPEQDRYEERVIPERIKKAKTSAAATFALVFGLAALFSALTGILAPFAVLFGVIGIVLGIAGSKMAKRLGVTGRGVAIGGLVTAVLGLLLGAAVLAGAAVYVNDAQRLDQLEQFIDDARNDLPSGSEIVEEIPGN